MALLLLVAHHENGNLADSPTGNRTIKDRPAVGKIRRCHEWEGKGTATWACTGPAYGGYTVHQNKIRTLVQFVLSVVIVGVVVNLASDYLGKQYRHAEKPLIEIALVALVAWAAMIVTQIVLSRYIGGRYAVEVLILNRRDELLMWWHPFHRVMLPPGGRVKGSEFPNDALQLRLVERLNLSPDKYQFDERFHHGLDANTGNLGEIQRLAAPFLVQRELHRQRAFVKLHYDFIYVLKLVSDDPVVGLRRYQPVHFVGMEALRDMVNQRRTFPDVLDAYSRVLDVIAQENK